MRSFKDWLDRHRLIPRLYDCPDVWLIMWRGYEFIIKKPKK